MSVRRSQVGGRRGAVPVSSLLNERLLRENGRTYLEDWLHVYPYPTDEAEGRRCDAIHHLFTAAFASPLQAILPAYEGRRYDILDLGSGTGIWACEMACSRSDVHITGIDLGEPAEGLIAATPANCTLISGVDFESDDWGLGARTFDLVRCGFLAGCVSDWPALLRRIMRVLKPGAQIELAELNRQPHLDPTIPIPSPCFTFEYWHLLVRAARDFGKPLDNIYPTIVAALEAGGFSITCERHDRLNIVEDCEVARGELLNVLARRTSNILFDPKIAHLEAMGMRLLTQRGMSERQVRAFCARVRNEMGRYWFKPFFLLDVVTARRPLR